MVSGFEAAWPRPQIEASRIAWLNSSSSSRFQTALLHQHRRLLGADPARRALAAALVLEEAHQVERRALHARPVSDRMTTAAEPMKQPYFSSVPKSSGMSSIDAGRMPPDAPPGR